MQSITRRSKIRAWSYHNGDLKQEEDCDIEVGVASVFGWLHQFLSETQKATHEKVYGRLANRIKQQHFLVRS